MAYLKNKFEKELASFRPGDAINGTSLLGVSEFPYIDTAGHGYLVVPNDHRSASLAKEICEYGYRGNEAVYLEQDCEMPRFLKLMAQVNND